MAKHSALRRPSYYVRKEAKAAKRFEPVTFRPIERSKFVTQSKVHMLNSVGGAHPNGDRWELIGGEDYWLDAPKADEFIIKGYCTGNLSRNYSDDEVAQIRSTMNIIDVSMNHKPVGG